MADCFPRTLVVVFLRGGADGLSLVPPVGDDDYHRARPTLALTAAGSLRLDGFFALHPLLAPLLPFWSAGQLAIVPAAGSDDATRSHFEAQDLMEHAGTAVSGGWLGRWLRALPGGAGGAVTAVAMDTALSESLRGAPSAIPFTTFADIAGDGLDGLSARLTRLYARDALLAAPARDAIAGATRLAALGRADYRSEHGAAYADRATGADDLAVRFSGRLREVAQMIKADLGLRAACVDLDGWDSHFVQDSVIAPRLRALGAGLAAFATDLGPRLATTSVVVMSEFGRRVAENTSLGTDHGRGGALFVLGGGTRGGVHCRWPGLKEERLDGPGDVPVVHDYRDVLAAVLARHGDADLTRVFPGHQAAPLPV
jgi:uncharacterized protein (DUF1501 family)